MGAGCTAPSTEDSSTTATDSGTTGRESTDQTAVDALSVSNARLVDLCTCGGYNPDAPTAQVDIDNTSGRPVRGFSLEIRYYNGDTLLSTSSGFNPILPSERTARRTFQELTLNQNPTRVEAVIPDDARVRFADTGVSGLQVRSTSIEKVRKTPTYGDDYYEMTATARVENTTAETVDVVAGVYIEDENQLLREGAQRQQSIPSNTEYEFRGRKINRERDFGEAAMVSIR